MSLPALGLVFVAVLLVSVAATAAVVRFLRRRAILDHPNARSSHERPTPRGGGLASTPVVVAAWAALALVVGEGEAGLLAACGGALALAAVSWLDDLRGVPPLARLGLQVGAVAVVLGVDSLGWTLAEAVVAGALWVWFVNLFNFMDGIDGLAGVETAAIGLGAAAVAVVAGLAAPTAGLGVAVAAAALGFLAWNWAPAKVFLGDVGSVPLGFLLGWLLLVLAAEGQWAAALILPLYYLADATITLGRRLMRGESPVRAHREHYYQRAVQRGLGHAAVVRHVLAADGVLVVLAVVATAGHAAPAIAGAVAVVAVLLAVLGGAGARSPAA